MVSLGPHCLLHHAHTHPHSIRSQHRCRGVSTRRLSCLDRRLALARHLVTDRPDDTGQLTRDGRHRDRRSLAAIDQMPVAPVQPALGLGADGDDARIDTLLAFGQCRTDGRGVARMVGGLDQDMPRTRIAGFGDPTLLAFVTTGGLRRRHAEVRHQFLRTLEATRVTERLGSPISTTSVAAVTSSTPRNAW